ncbi:MAG: hypothetical protein QXF07_01460 [Candidatus Micrarchaeia archaeon]
MSGGLGENAKSNFLKKEVMRWNNDIKFEEYNAESNEIIRPNLLFSLDRMKEKTVCFIAHMDTVK